MPDNKGNLYLYEAIELRGEHDQHIGLLEGLLGLSVGPAGMVSQRRGPDGEEL